MMIHTVPAVVEKPEAISGKPAAGEKLARQHFHNFRFGKIK